MNQDSTSTTKTWTQYLQELPSFEQELLKALDKLLMTDVSKTLKVDHACIRFSDAKEVDMLRVELKDFGQELSCTEVNGRDIVIVQLDEPLQIVNWKVNGLELPYPKLNQKIIDGWEHVEFVLPDAENTIEGMRQAFFESFPFLELDSLKRDYHYKEDAPHAAGEQLANPTIAIKVDGVGIKLHANSIQDVVRSS